MRDLAGGAAGHMELQAVQQLHARLADGLRLVHAEDQSAFGACERERRGRRRGQREAAGGAEMERERYDLGDGGRCVHNKPHSAHIFMLFADETLVVPIEQRDVVREYIEKLVASMVGGDATLDRVPIGQLYSNLNCKCIIINEST